MQGPRNVQLKPGIVQIFCGDIFLQNTAMRPHKERDSLLQQLSELCPKSKTGGTMAPSLLHFASVTFGEM
jgi:hypothetical protein